jgi:hypothetical protein
MNDRYRSKINIKHALSMSLALAVPAFCVGQSANSGADAAAGTSTPSTRPSHVDAPANANSSGSNSGGGNFGGYGGGGGSLYGEGQRRGPGAPGWPRPFAQEEATDAIAFFTKNSPNRMKYFNLLPADGFARRAETSKLVQLYRPLQNFKESNPKLYDLLVQQVKLRDQAFQAALEGRDADLRSLADQIVPVSLQARQLRLDLLQKELDDQKTKLTADEANKDAASEHEVTEIKHEEERLVRRAQHQKMQIRGQSLLNFDPDMDPLASVAPIATEGDVDDAASGL